MQTKQHNSNGWTPPKMRIPTDDHFIMSSQATFPVRLHAMLAEMEKDSFLSSMISWRPHGRLFVVLDREGFMKHILPCWFTMTTYPSFQRQLNMYGFKTMSSGPDKGGYYHELFLKGHPQLALRIPRIKFKGSGPRKPAAPESEPNFYAMPKVPPPAMVVRATAFGASPRCGDPSLQMMALPGMVLPGTAVPPPPPRPGRTVTLSSPMTLASLGDLTAAPVVQSHPGNRMGVFRGPSVASVPARLPHRERLQHPPRTILSERLQRPPSQQPTPREDPATPAQTPWDRLVQDIFDLLSSDDDDQSGDTEPLPFDRS